MISILSCRWFLVGFFISFHALLQSASILLPLPCGPPESRSNKTCCRLILWLYAIGLACHPVLVAHSKTEQFFPPPVQNNVPAEVQPFLLAQQRFIFFSNNSWSIGGRLQDHFLLSQRDVPHLRWHSLSRKIDFSEHFSFQITTTRIAFGKFHHFGNQIPRSAPFDQQIRAPLTLS